MVITWGPISNDGEVTIITSVSEMPMGSYSLYECDSVIDIELCNQFEKLLEDPSISCITYITTKKIYCIWAVNKLSRSIKIINTKTGIPIKNISISKSLISLTTNPSGIIKLHKGTIPSISKDGHVQINEYNIIPSQENIISESSDKYKYPIPKERLVNKDPIDQSVTEIGIKRPKKDVNICEINNETLMNDTELLNFIKNL